MLRPLTAAAVIASAACLWVPSHAQLPTDALVVTDFRELALDVGGEEEDWQPAFQAAIARARETRQPVYVPAGEYRIRRAIEIVPPDLDKRPFGSDNVRIVGAGMFKSVVIQSVEAENCVDWTGLEYEKSEVRGELEDISLRGGEITLNIKWHNHFRMDSCYLEGSGRYGVYAEGWSSRFLNSIIRWCGEAGIVGAGHFNNCIIRDCYFSRDGIGILLSGVHGSRIEGCGLESCARAAIFVRNTRGLTIADSYFEGNGYRLAQFPFEGVPNTISLDMNNMGIEIHDNILRVNRDEEGALISIADCRGGHIYDNLFYCYNPGRHGIRLRGVSETKPEWQTAIADLVVESNTMHQVVIPLSEDTPGVYDRAVAAGCSFDLALSGREG